VTRNILRCNTPQSRTVRERLEKAAPSPSRSGFTVPRRDVAAQIDQTPLARRRSPERCGFHRGVFVAALGDGRASWFVEEHELLRTIGPIIACPEAPFSPRLARRFEHAPDLSLVYRHWLRCAAATGDGLLVPMGFEFAAAEDMDDRQTANAFATNGAARNLDMTAAIREANALSEQLKKRGIAGEMRTLTDPAAPVTVLLRADAPDVRQARNPIVVVINPDWKREHPLPVSLDPLPPAAGASLAAKETIAAEEDSSAVLARGEARVLRAHVTEPVKSRRAEVRPTKLAAASRIVIDNVVPSVEGGRFAAKAVVGEAVTIAADVFIDGQDLLAVEVLWRAADEKEWRHEPMRLLGNDRWQTAILPDRIGRHEFAVEAWVDRYGSLCRDVEVKRAAGADVAVEIAEARHLLEQARERTQDDAGSVIAAALNWLRDIRHEGLFPPASFRQHAGHQSVLPSDVGAPGLPHSRRASGDTLRPVGDVFGVRAVRGGGFARPRGISGLREVRNSRPLP
jgi:starch synthase (maltosyl-transferring)